MATINSLTNKIDGKGVHLFEYGYMKAPEASLLMYNLEELNSDDFDFRNAKLKNAADKVSATETGNSIQRYDEDLKEATITLDTRTSATKYEVSVNNMQVGEMIYNQTTGETQLVEAVSGNVIDLSTADGSSQATDVLVRLNFAKKYGIDHGFKANRNDLVPYTNYIQYTEAQIDSDMIENNKTRVFINDGNEYLKKQFANASRKIIKGMVSSRYYGISSATNVGGDTIYTTGGLDSFIPGSFKQNVKGSDKADTKKNIRKQLTKAYQSGVDGIYDKNKLLFFCTTTWMDLIDSLYEDKLQYNEELTKVKIHIKSYMVGGKNMNMVNSTVLDEISGEDFVGGFLVPIDYVFLYMLPVSAAKASGKSLEVAGRGKVYKKPQSTPEKSVIALFTHYAFMFGNITSGAYRKLYYEA